MERERERRKIRKKLTLNGLEINAADYRFRKDPGICLLARSRAESSIGEHLGTREI